MRGKRSKAGGRNTTRSAHTAVWRTERQTNTQQSALSSPAGWAPPRRTARRLGWIARRCSPARVRCSPHPDGCAPACSAPPCRQAFSRRAAPAGWLRGGNIKLSFPTSGWFKKRDQVTSAMSPHLPAQCADTLAFCNAGGSRAWPAFMLAFAFQARA